MGPPACRGSWGTNEPWRNAHMARVTCDKPREKQSECDLRIGAMGVKWRLRGRGGAAAAVVSEARGELCAWS